MAPYVYLVVNEKWKMTVLILILLANTYGMNEMEDLWSDTTTVDAKTEDEALMPGSVTDLWNDTTTVDAKTEDEASMPESATDLWSDTTTVDAKTEDETSMPESATDLWRDTTTVDVTTEVQTPTPESTTGFWSDATTVDVKTEDETPTSELTTVISNFITTTSMAEEKTVDVTTEDEASMSFTTLTQSETKNTFPTVGIFRTQPADASVLTGEDHVLTCSIRNRELTVGWLKDGRPVEYNYRVLKRRSRILVRNVVNSDSGVYTCIASDIQGNQVASISAQVKVLQHGLNRKACGTVTSPEVPNATEEPASLIGLQVGRQNAVKGSAPWMARLYVRGRGHICGGTLIDRQWVVTAAHCFHLTDPPTKEDLSIRLGDHDVLDTEASEMLIQVEEIYEHEQFDYFTYDNDIALVKLANPITAYSDYIRPICVTDKVKDRRLMTVGTIGRVNGWGRVLELGLAPQFLTEINIPLVSFPTCKRHFRQSLTTFTRNMFCAGRLRGGADACQGDSGGPYSVKDNRGRWYLAGIVSWGEGCDRPGQYGVYTRYSKYYDWIRRTMRMSRMNTPNSNR